MECDLYSTGVSLGPAVGLIAQPLLDELHAHIATLTSPGPSASKPYLVQWLGRYPKHDPASIWARIAKTLKPIAAAYLDSPPRLHFYNLWESLPTTDGPQHSQVWHRDQEDTRLLKAFLYLTDVTPSAGPLSYIPKTHWLGSLKLKPKTTYQPFLGVAGGVPRVLDPDMAACVPESDWQTFCVPKGTILLADTTGWHKGGYATTMSRVCAVWEWTTTQAVTRPRLR